MFILSLLTINKGIIGRLKFFIAALVLCGISQNAMAYSHAKCDSKSYTCYGLNLNIGWNVDGHKVTKVDAVKSGICNGGTPIMGSSNLNEVGTTLPKNCTYSN